MAQMTVIYRTPADKAAFDQLYFNVHIPLAKQLPGLIKYEISKAPLISTNRPRGYLSYRQSLF